MGLGHHFLERLSLSSSSVLVFGAKSYSRASAAFCKLSAASINAVNGDKPDSTHERGSK